MAKLRYIGTDVGEVRVLGRHVKPEEVIEVPDELVSLEPGDGGRYAWGEDLWKVVTAPKHPKPAASDGTAPNSTEEKGD